MPRQTDTDRAHKAAAEARRHADAVAARLPGSPAAEAAENDARRAAVAAASGCAAGALWCAMHAAANAAAHTDMNRLRRAAIRAARRAGKDPIYPRLPGDPAHIGGRPIRGLSAPGAY